MGSLTPLAPLMCLVLVGGAGALIIGYLRRSNRKLYKEWESWEHLHRERPNLDDEGDEA